MFSEEKVTHMASYLLLKRGGRMSYMKLLKLLYLAEREALVKWGESMSGDKFVSMPRGPVMSNTLGLMQAGSLTFWDSFISSKENYEVALNSGIEIDHLDDLSRSEMNILDGVFTQYGNINRWEIVDYTHDHCAEWQDPNGSSFPIKTIDVLLAKGLSPEEASFMLEHGAEQSMLDDIKRAIA
jgi:uncharacterized phage-associated protein